MNESPPPFHLAIPVTDLPSTREFYGKLFGCPEGRSADTWVDFDFFGHQLVCHVLERPSADPSQPDSADGESVEGDFESHPTNPVDGHDVPIPHFGVVLDMATWQALADKLRRAQVNFVIEPYIRFAGQPGEQATMFLLDPSGNALEFKAFRDISGQLFAK